MIAKVGGGLFEAVFADGFNVKVWPKVITVVKEVTAGIVAVLDPTKTMAAVLGGDVVVSPAGWLLVGVVGAGLLVVSGSGTGGITSPPGPVQLKSALQVKELLGQHPKPQQIVPRKRKGFSLLNFFCFALGSDGEPGPQRFRFPLGVWQHLSSLVPHRS